MLIFYFLQTSVSHQQEKQSNAKYQEKNERKSDGANGANEARERVKKGFEEESVSATATRNADYSNEAEKISKEPCQQKKQTLISKKWICFFWIECISGKKKCRSIIGETIKEKERRLRGT